MSGLCLLVEDNDLTAVTIESCLQELGWETRIASSAAEALRLLAETDTVQLLLTDIRMPGGSGVDLARQASEARKDLRILFVTGCVLEELEDARATGFPVLLKPFGLSMLSAAIASLYPAAERPFAVAEGR